jgi:hypothetical protein
VTFITEQGEVNKDSEAPHNSALRTPSRGVRPGLFDFQEIRTANRRQNQLVTLYRNQANKVRSPPHGPFCRSNKRRPLPVRKAKQIAIVALAANAKK